AGTVGSGRRIRDGGCGGGGPPGGGRCGLRDRWGSTDRVGLRRHAVPAARGGRADLVRDEPAAGGGGRRAHTGVAAASPRSSVAGPTRDDPLAVRPDRAVRR